MNIEIKTVTISINIFYVSGKQVCSIGTGEGESCKYLGVKRFGMQFTCLAICESVHREGETGYILAYRDCPLTTVNQND